MKIKKATQYLLCALLLTCSAAYAKKKDDIKIWDLDMLNSMDFSGGVDGALNNTDPSFYEQLYVFGDALSDSGNLLGTRFIPNQWPWPLGEGVNVYGEPLSIIFTHKIPFPILDNKSFPTAKMASGFLNTRSRIDLFLGSNIINTNTNRNPITNMLTNIIGREIKLGGYAKAFNQNEIFVFWSGFNDAKEFVRDNRFNVYNYSKPDFSRDVASYVEGIKKISDLDGDIIFMNIPDTLAFPGGRLSARSGFVLTTLRNISKLAHLDFNQASHPAYLDILHNGTGVVGLDKVIARDLSDFKQKYWFINPQLIDKYAAAYYHMQLDTVNTLNQQLYNELEKKIDKKNIIYADIRGFIRELMNDPDYVGIDNVQSPECGPYSSANSCKTNPADQGYNYLYGDDFNLSFKGQKEIFSYLSMMIATPFILAGFYNSVISSNIDMNTDLINGYSIKVGNMSAKPSMTLLYNRQWDYMDKIEIGYNLGLRMMNYRVPFANMWATTSYWSPYINYKLNDYIALGLENQTSVGYYEIRREVSLEGREPMSMRDRYEKANINAEKILFAGTARFTYEDDKYWLVLRGLLGPGYAINHRYEERTKTSTSVSFLPNDLLYLHGEVRLNLEFKKFPTNRLNFGIEGTGHYNQTLNDLKLTGNTKRAPVKFERKIKLITNYEGDWGAYLKYKPNKKTIIKYGYQGRNYNYVIRNGVFINLQYKLD